MAYILVGLPFVLLPVAFITDFFAFGFVLTPTPDPPFLTAGVLIPVIVLSFLYRDTLRRPFLRGARRTARASGKPLTRLGKLLTYGILPPFGFVLYTLATLQTLALARDVIAGHPVTFIVTVSNPRPLPGRGQCSRQVNLVGVLPGRLCNLPLGLRNSLQKGERLHLDGIGTSWGMFVHEVTPVRG